MEAETPAAPAMPPKVDPETLVLRARPQLAARFKRGVIIGAAAVGAGGVATLGYVALRPHIHTAGDQQSDLSQPAQSGTPDALSGLPSSYGAVPKLGPPLPGDLGKPILEHQQSTLVTDAGQQPGVAESAVAAEQQKAADALREARQSGLLVQTKSDSAPAPTSSVTAATTPPTTTQTSLDPGNDPNAQGHKADFVKTLDTEGVVNAHPMMAPASPNMLSAGTIIAGSLITGLRSDLPGLVTAMVTQNVFDTATGRILLIPQGARLIGSYDSVVAFGQRRALVVWQRIIWPDSSSISIDNVPATDASGYSGLEDKVDFHTWQLLKGVAISTLLGIGADLQFSGRGGLVDAIRQSGEQNVSRAGDQLTSKTLNIQPTITIRPGAPIRLIVHRDLVLRRWTGAAK
ncbi:TrbI/VirB10 family protein [Sphingomonas sp. MAHUQ-71]|uniref:TrbI/VirB10 family protein n=1 Tax=Sphingomonas oryzagri TaxID=3042314 RepID=A0ABT6N006_9SPHN|nr:TrbI/VirB10 family protein [Sphingomonas oryzagri]